MKSAIDHISQYARVEWTRIDRTKSFNDERVRNEFARQPFNFKAEYFKKLLKHINVAGDKFQRMFFERFVNAFVVPHSGVFEVILKDSRFVPDYKVLQYMMKIDDLPKIKALLDHPSITDHQFRNKFACPIIGFALIFGECSVETFEYLMKHPKVTIFYPRIVSDAYFMFRKSEVIPVIELLLNDPRVTVVVADIPWGREITELAVPIAQLILEKLPKFTETETIDILAARKYLPEVQELILSHKKLI